MQKVFWMLQPCSFSFPIQDFLQITSCFYHQKKIYNISPKDEFINYTFSECVCVGAVVEGGGGMLVGIVLQ